MNEKLARPPRAMTCQPLAASAKSTKSQKFSCGGWAASFLNSRMTQNPLKFLQRRHRMSARPFPLPENPPENLRRLEGEIVSAFVV